LDISNINSSPLATAGKPTTANRDPKEDAKLKAACADMEAVFLNILLQQMRRTVPKTGLLGEKSSQQEIMRSLLDSEMAKNMANAGGTGLANMLYRQLTSSNNRTNKDQAPR
jgi:flagellar protein FlgJ